MCWTIPYPFIQPRVHQWTSCRRTRPGKDKHVLIRCKKRRRFAATFRRRLGNKMLRTLEVEVHGLLEYIFWPTKDIEVTPPLQMILQITSRTSSVTEGYPGVRPRRHLAWPGYGAKGRQLLGLHSLYSVLHMAPNIATDT